MIALLWACSFGGPSAEARANPLWSLERADRTPVVGSVAEVLPAGGYLYVAVDGVWFATLGQPLKVGQTVTLGPIGVANDFRSGKLNRTFDRVTFATLEVHQP